MNIAFLKIEKLPAKAAFALFAAALIVLHYSAAKWAFANMAASAADMPEVAGSMTAIAPDDPQTHFSAAVLYDRTFLAENQGLALSEYERAVGLEPANYLLWLEYAKALGRSGENERALTALFHARSLAPEHSAVRWAVGNALVRAGRPDEGFAEIRAATAADEKLAAPAAAIAFGYFDGDIERVRAAASDSPAINAALVVMLVREKRVDEAMSIWRRLVGTSGPPTSAEIIDAIFNELIAAKRYRAALEIRSTADRSGGVSTGTITNGGFESQIQLERAPPFTWQISAGQQPQVVLTEGQRHGGSRSLAVVYSSANGSGLREVKQIVAVNPSARYQFSGFYRSDLNSSAPLAWRIVGSGGVELARAELKQKAADWQQFSVEFAVPADEDGVTIELVRAACGAVCPINGNVWFDDLSLAPK